MPALLHMLEWAYQFLSFDQGSPIFRQHATSLLGLIDLTSNINDENIYRMMLTKLNVCFSKWFYGATNSNIEVLKMLFIFYNFSVISMVFLGLARYFAFYVSTFIDTFE